MKEKVWKKKNENLGRGWFVTNNHFSFSLCTLAGQLSPHLSFRPETVHDLADAIVAPLLAVQRSDAALLDHLDATFVDVHLAICAHTHRSNQNTIDDERKPREKGS